MIVKRFVIRLKKMYDLWQQDDGSLLAAAVSFYAALSFFPLLLVLISGLGIAMQATHWGEDAEQKVLLVIGEYASQGVANSVQGMLEKVQRQAVVGGPIGLAILAFTAATLFANFEMAFDRIWNTESAEISGIWDAAKNILFYRLRAFLLLLSLGVLIVVVFIAGLALSIVQNYSSALLAKYTFIWNLVEIGSSVALNSIVFTLIYRLLPKVKVHWSEAARGALLAAIGWEVGRLVLTSFVVGERYSAYGVIGSFLAVMVWIYYASTVLFMGAEYIQVICHDCNSANGRT